MLRYVIINEEVEIIGCDRKELRSTDGVLIIPTHIEGKQVKSIRNCAFEDCRELKKVIIEGDLHLGWATFAGCVNLEVVIAPKITKIEMADTFRFCESLAEVDLSSLESIDHIDTFTHCKSLKELELPNLKHLYSWGSFEYMKSLEVLSLPSLKTGGNLTLITNEDNKKDLDLISEVGSNPTTFKHIDPKIDRHTPSLKKLVIPKQLINKDFNLDILSFEVELV